MSFTARDIALTAQDAVRDAYRSGPDARHEAFIRDYLGTPAHHRRSAILQFEAAQQSVRESGYRVTQRIKDGLWAELERIAAEAEISPKMAA